MVYLDSITTEGTSLPAPDSSFRPFRDQFKLECDKRNTTFASVAERLDVGRSYITNLFRFGVSLDKLRWLSEGLGVPPETFDAYFSMRHPEALKQEDPDAIAFADMMATYYRLGPRKRQAMMQAITEITHNFKD